MSQRRLSGFFQVFAPMWSKNESRDILKVHTWNSDLFQVGEWVYSDVRAGNPMRRYTCHDLAGSCPWGKNWEEGQRGEDRGPSHSRKPPLGARGGFLIEYMDGWNLEWVQCTRGFLEVLWHLHMELNLQRCSFGISFPSLRRHQILGNRAHWVTCKWWSKNAGLRQKLWDNLPVYCPLSPYLFWLSLHPDWKSQATSCRNIKKGDRHLP